MHRRAASVLAALTAHSGSFPRGDDAPFPIPGIAASISGIAAGDWLTARVFLVEGQECYVGLPA